MTKPGFLKSRIKALFNSDDISEQNRVVSIYNKWRSKQPTKEKHCYCGHTLECECGNPGIYEFKSGLSDYGGIDEDVLNEIL